MHPDYERLLDAFNTTLGRAERIEQIVQMARILSDKLPAVALYFKPRVVGFAAALQGPQRIAPDGSVSANIHNWQWR